MLSRSSFALITLLTTALVAFTGALVQFNNGVVLPFELVDWPIVLRDLVLCLTAFLLFTVTAYLPVRKSIAIKLTLGFGLVFLGFWQNLLNDLIISRWWLTETVALIGAPLGLALAAAGLQRLGRVHQINRLMLGRYETAERNLATIDQLTQLYNRRYFFSACSPLLSEAIQRNHRPAVLGIRIMNLAPLNRLLGFQAGDEALIRVSKAIRRHLRPEYIAGRLGGRRFAIFMPDTPPHQAEELAQSIRSRVEHVVMTSNLGEEILIGIELECQICVAQPEESLDELLARTGVSSKPGATAKLR